jgi:hypothetical protein
MKPNFRHRLFLSTNYATFTPCDLTLHLSYLRYSLNAAAKAAARRSETTYCPQHFHSSINKIQHHVGPHG